MTDPFIELLNNRPNTTTLTPGRDIDYILTYGLNIQNISTLGINMPARSDHQGIGIDICTEELFTGRYSTLHQQPRRLLTLNNVRAKITYVKYITDAVVQHNLLNRLIDLYKIAMEGNFNDSHESQLNQIDRQLTDILLCGESKCAKNHRSRHAWSPQLRTAGRTLVYWKQKTRMANKKTFHWKYLDNLRTNTDISSEDHLCMDLHKIHQCLCSARKRWKDIKQRSHELRNQFLSELADEHAAKMRTDKETALKAILRTEEAKQTYANIQTITGNKKEKIPFTQVDIRCPTNSTNTITLTTKHEIEEAIIKRNQLHARQALQTPFASTQGLSDAINPNNPNNSIEKILHGSFLNELPPEIELSEPERVWIQELQQKLQRNVDIYISPDDFKVFFKHRKERTASSSSGRHMGHYKILAERMELDCAPIVDVITKIINISILTSRPLQRWKKSAQIMLEKGKGRFIEHLRIIQLCEADLNFALNVIWGKRLINNAMKHKALDPSQYALPGMTCNSAVWNKVLFCDLLRQTMSTGIMTDYDATVAFDRVLHAITILTCRRLGLPQEACLFMYSLLQEMEFHLITGFGKSTLHFKNNDDPSMIGQGVLQGSSSAAPLYNITSDISLTAYRKIAKGASFIHPISGTTISDTCTQYVDDKTDLLNAAGAGLRSSPHLTTKDREELFSIATDNSNKWASLLWISGGNLNSSKCFY